MLGFQVNYALKVLRPIIDNMSTSVEPHEGATKIFNDRLQSKLHDSPYSQCNSWYRSGVKRKIAATWPGLGSSFWWQTLSPTWGDYLLS